MAEHGWDERLAALQDRLTAQAETQIQAWHAERTAMLDRAIGRFADVGVDITHHWQGVDQPLQEVRTQKDLSGIQADMARALAMTTEDREWRDVEQTPEYQAWEREQGIPIHEPDAAELGWQAEQRFYAEQDPQSEWYREDLYHGQPGPDVVRDWEPTRAEQPTYEDRPHDMLEDRAHGGDVSESGDVPRQLSLMEMAEEHANGRAPDESLEIDTSNADMGQRWEAQLAAIEARLDALTHAVESHEHAHEQGIEY